MNGATRCVAPIGAVPWFDSTAGPAAMTANHDGADNGAHDGNDAPRRGDACECMMHAEPGTFDGRGECLDEYELSNGGSLKCSRPEGHDGPHAACGTAEHPALAWPDDDGNETDAEYWHAELAAYLREHTDLDAPVRPHGSDAVKFDTDDLDDDERAFLHNKLQRAGFTPTSSARDSTVVVEASDDRLAVSFRGGA